MQKKVFHISDFIHELVVDDTLFARAYENSADHHRALMKTCIARLYDWYGPRQQVGGRVSHSWRSGLESQQLNEPVDCTLILLDDSLLSPIRLLAALVPALVSGCENILVARLDCHESPWSESILTGLELAGQERVVDVTAEQLDTVLAEIEQNGGRGCVVDLRQEPDSSLQSSRIQYVAPSFNRRAIIWTNDEQGVDIDALSFAHPDVTFTVFGRESELPTSQFSFDGTEFEIPDSTISDVIYADNALHEEALSVAKLVLGPGNEGCWIWSEITPELFQSHCISWTTGA